MHAALETVRFLQRGLWIEAKGCLLGCWRGVSCNFSHWGKSILKQ